MQLNVLDDLAEAMKALEEKSTVDPPKGNGLGKKKGLLAGEALVSAVLFSYKSCMKSLFL